MWDRIMQKFVKEALWGSLIVLFVALGFSRGAWAQETVWKSQSLAQAGTCIPRQDAVAILKRDVIKPSDQNKNLLAFGLHEPLTPGARLGPYLPSPLPDHVEIAPYMDPSNMREITSPVWFFWLDDEPASEFEHNTRFVFIDCETGNVTMREEKWWPVLDGISLWTDDEDYWDENNWVFSRLKHITKPDLDHAALEGSMDVPFDSSRPLARFSFLQNLTFLPAAHAAEVIECAVVANGWHKGQSLGRGFGINAKGMSDALGKFAKGRVKTLGPKKNGTNAEKRGTSLKDFKKAVKDLIADEKCTDLVLYVGGHGSKTNKGSIWVGRDRLRGSTLKKMIKENPKVTFKVIIQGCYSGAFANSLDLPNVGIVITSVRKDEKSSHDLDPPWDPNPKDEGSEFTSGFVEDLNLANDPKVKKKIEQIAKKKGVDFMIALLDYAFESAWTKDASRRAKGRRPTRSFPRSAYPGWDAKGKLKMKKDNRCRECKVPRGGEEDIKFRATATTADGKTFEVDLTGTMKRDGTVKVKVNGGRGKLLSESIRYGTNQGLDAYDGHPVPVKVKVTKITSDRLETFKESCDGSKCSGGGKCRMKITPKLPLELPVKAGKVGSFTITARCECAEDDEHASNNNAGENENVAMTTPQRGYTSVEFTSLAGKTNVRRDRVGQMDTILITAVDGSLIEPDEEVVEVNEQGETVSIDVKTPILIASILLAGSNGEVELFSSPENAMRRTGEAWPSDGDVRIGNGRLQETFSVPADVSDMSQPPGSHSAMFNGTPVDVIATRTSQIAVSGRDIALPGTGNANLVIAAPSGKGVSTDVPAWSYEVTPQPVVRTGVWAPILFKCEGLPIRAKVEVTFYENEGQMIEPKQVSLLCRAAETPIPIAQYQTAIIGPQRFDVVVTRTEEED
jgi:hypothetical protein